MRTPSGSVVNCAEHDMPILRIGEPPGWGQVQAEPHVTKSSALTTPPRRQRRNSASPLRQNEWRATPASTGCMPGREGCCMLALAGSAFPSTPPATLMPPWVSLHPDLRRSEASLQGSLAMGAVATPPGCSRTGGEAQSVRMSLSASPRFSPRPFRPSPEIVI